VKASVRKAAAFRARFAVRAGALAAPLEPPSVQPAAGRVSSAAQMKAKRKPRVRRQCK
jgi:hypothetical protein